jgi:NADH-quinone oxidoreductase subunit A
MGPEPKPELKRMTSYAALLLFLIASVGLVGLIVGLNAYLGPRPEASGAKLEPFECGVPPLQRANVRPLSIKYYPIAIFFLLFDLETVLLFIWAMAAGQADIATLSLVSFLVFMALLALVFAYLWRDGGLEWR